MDAIEYNAVLIKQQEQKVKDLHAEAIDLHHRFLMTTGAARDAEQDLARFQRHAVNLKAGEPVPDLI